MGDVRPATDQELGELRATFDIAWNADMRAIKRWQEAHPGNDDVWPDRADMVVWLMDQLDEKVAQGWHHTFPWQQHAPDDHLFDARCVICGLRATKDYVTASSADVDGAGQFDLVRREPPQEPRWPSATRENAVALAKARTVIREEAWDEFDDEERGFWIEDSREVLVRLHEAGQS